MGVTRVNNASLFRGAGLHAGHVPRRTQTKYNSRGLFQSHLGSCKNLVSFSDHFRVYFLGYVQLLLVFQ